MVKNKVAPFMRTAWIAICATVIKTLSLRFSYFFDELIDLNIFLYQVIIILYYKPVAIHSQSTAEARQICKNVFVMHTN